MSGWGDDSGANSQWVLGYVPFNGREIARYAWSTYFNFAHPNGLGSGSMSNDQAGNLLQDILYPWGQVWQDFGAAYNPHFAGIHAAPFQCVDAVCGYMSTQFVATHENAYNGILYSSSEWLTFLYDRVDAQQQALADAIVAANPNLLWDEVHTDLNYLYTNGGNANFEYLGNPYDLSFIPGYNTGGGALSRYGGVPSVHMPGTTDDDNPILHLDSANPLWGFGLGAFLHGSIDVGIGNINPSVPMAPW